MKKPIRKLYTAILATGALVILFNPHNAMAQSAVVTTSSDVTTMGTISEFNPQAIVIRTETNTAPVSYVYSKTTTYVDESGTPVSMDIIKSGLPVTVYYTKNGDVMTASKVIVRKVVEVPNEVIQEKKTTTTTTTEQQ